MANNTFPKLLDAAINFIVETQIENDYICGQMNPEYCEAHCIDHLRKSCVIEFLNNEYEPEEEYL